MKNFSIICLLAWCGFAKAQLPPNGDLTAFGQMHVTMEKERVQEIRKENDIEFFQGKAFEVMKSVEFHKKNKELRDRGSLTLSDGTVLEENKNINSQPIDPRTPQGFGNPFFREIHVKMNMEMGLSPKLEEEMHKEDAKADINCTECENNTMYDDFMDEEEEDSVSHHELMIETSQNYFSNSHYEITNSRANRTVFHNGTEFDQILATTCVTKRSKKYCFEKEYEYSNYLEQEFTSFENGICPDVCSCVKGLVKSKRAREKMIEQCKDACARTDLVGILTCASFKQKADRVQKSMKAKLTQKLGGFGKGMKLKKNHPLGKEIKRSAGTF